jgi:lipid A 3-O-deacylase
MTRTMAIVAAATTLLFLLAANAGAQSAIDIHDCEAPRLASPTRSSVLSFQLENDLFAGTDAQYTSGVKFTWTSPNLTDFNDPLLPAWIRCSNEQVRRLVDWFHPEKATSINMVVTLGQAMYTPADRDRTTIDPNDRPYAGWTYLGLGYNARFDPNNKSDTPTLDTVELDIGIVGRHAYAKQTQDLVHRLRGLDRFQGWENQLSDELGLQFVWERKLRPSALTIGKFAKPGEPDASGGSAKGLAAQIIPHYGVSVGNVASYVNVGGELRVGWRLPDDFGTSSIRPGGDNAAPRAAAQLERVYHQHSFHFFASFDGRAVANNIFLDGNTFKRSYAVKRRLLVGDIAYGWAYTWPKYDGLPSGKLAYAHYVQSREFEGEARNHGFGSVNVSLEF